MMSESFNLDYAKQLSQDSFNQAKEYITKFFIPLDNGKHLFLKNGTYEMRDEADIKKAFFNRICDKKDSRLSDYYFKEFTGVKTITYELNKPLFFDNYINLCPKMKHEQQEYKTFSTDVKGKVEIVLKFIKNIWCSNETASYNFCVRWLANMIKGNKNNSCLYLKSAVQGLGKSTIPIFLRNHVIGNKLCLETGSEPIKSKFNNILLGKLLVVLEELENFSVAEWQAVSTNLKRNITSDTINIQSKNVDAYEEKNINNYILISNNDAIKDDDGRRYFVLDLCTDFVGNDAYFNNIYNSCFNDEVGKAFYNYMLEIDTNNFNPQSYPLTKNKKDSISKALDSAYNFLKYSYVLKRQDIYATVEDLYQEYLSYSRINDVKRPHGKINFNKKLSEINIKYYQTSGGKENKYKISHSELLEISNKFKWIHDLDTFQDAKEEDEENDLPDPNGFDFGLQTNYKQKYEDLLVQYNALREQHEKEKVDNENSVKQSLENINNKLLETIINFQNLTSNKQKETEKAEAEKAARIARAMRHATGYAGETETETETETEADDEIKDEVDEEAIDDLIGQILN